MLKLSPSRIALCFFGITRALALTHRSIEENLIHPARTGDEVRLFGHFFRQSAIMNPRSGENSIHDPDNYKLLELDWVKLEEPDTFIDHSWFSKIKSFGDEYDDDFRSIRNLVHQLHSLRKVSSAALSWGAHIYIFARPDILYHDSFDKVLSEASRATDDCIFIPNWANWGPGYNDRFCVCVGDRAARAYAERLRHVESFCADKGKLHAEKLLKYSVDRSGVNVSHFRVCGSRVRSNGNIVKENFDDFRLVRFKQRLRLPQRLIGRALSRLSSRN